MDRDKYFILNYFCVNLFEELLNNPIFFENETRIEFITKIRHLFGIEFIC